MKVNKKIMSAAIAFAMIASSFSGMLHIGGKLSASAWMAPIMNGKNDFVFQLGQGRLATKAGLITEINSIEIIKNPGDPFSTDFWIKAKGKVDARFLVSGADIYFSVYDLQEDPHRSRGRSTELVVGRPYDPYQGWINPQTGDFEVLNSMGPDTVFSPTYSTTLQIRVTGIGGETIISQPTPIDYSALAFNIGPGQKIVYPPAKAVATIETKPGLNADIIPANKEVTTNDIFSYTTKPGADVPNPGPYNLGDLKLQTTFENIGTANFPTLVPTLPKDGISIKADGKAVLFDDTVVLPATFDIQLSAPANDDFKAVIEGTQLPITIAKGDQTFTPSLNQSSEVAGGKFTLPTYTSTKAGNVGTRAPVVLGPVNPPTGTLKNVALNGNVLTWTPDPTASGTITIPISIAGDNFYKSASGVISVVVAAKPAQTISFGTSPTQVNYDGANLNTTVTATATPTGIAAGTTPGKISYAITQGGNIATIDATTGVISWTGYGAVTVEATAEETKDSAASKGTHVITRKKALLSLTSKNPRVNNKGPASIDTLVGSTVKAGDTLSGLNQYNVTYKLATDTGAEVALDFAVDKNLKPGEYLFSARPKSAETANYLTPDVATGKFTVSNASTDDDTYLTVFYDVGANGTITSGTSSEQVVQGGKPRHIPTVKGTTGFEHTGWSLNGTVVDPSTVVVNQNVTFKAVYNGEVVKPEIPSDLAFNKELKVPYIKGDPDGKFRPQDSITRAEFATIISRVLNRTMPKDQSTATSFTDVASNAWYAKEIAFVHSLGLINGYEDGAFRPEASITRAEATTIIMRVEKIKGETVTGTLKDVSGNWAEKEIIAAYAQGIINGYPDGTFRPDNKITRAETVTIMNKVLDIKPVEARAVFTDIMGHWAANQITAAATIDVIRAAITGK